MNIKDLSTNQIQRIIVIKKKIEKLQIRVQRRVEKLQDKIDSIAGDGAGRRGPGRPKGKRRMSAAGRRAIAKAARARWAKYRGKGVKKSKLAKKKDRRSSPAVRAKLAAAAKARWAKARAEGKRTL
jgi:hypothetical protein